MADPETVFVVEDDPSFRRALVWLLESVGHRTRAFGSAGDFLAEFEPGTPGCLLTDMRLPQMSGLELLERLRAAGAAIPVIVLTAHGTVPTGVRAMKLGALDFIEKPFDEQHMLDLVSVALENDRAERRNDRERRALTKALEGLSPREEAVLRGILTDQDNSQIAGSLEVGVKTVETYRSRILNKTGFETMADLRRALERLAVSLRPVANHRPRAPRPKM